jgi:6-phosphogluconolactonase (cycloisomerase 2 family)
MTLFLARLIAALAVGLLAGCLFGGGGGSPADPGPGSPPPVTGQPPAVVLPPLLAYVTGNGQHDLTAFDVDPVTGDLTQIATPVAAGFNPKHVVVDPLGRFAYVAAYESLAVRSYRLDPSSRAPAFASESAPDYRVRRAAVHPSGRFVYAADEDNDRIAMFSVDEATGQLAPLVPGTVTTGRAPHSVMIHPNGSFAYVANSGEDTIGVYAIDQSTGVLTEIPANLFALPPGAAIPLVLVIDPKGEFAYLGSTGASSEKISAFAVNPTTGALTLLGTPLSINGQNPQDIAVHPSGKFVYVVVGIEGRISAFARVGNTLSFIDSFPVGENPSAIAVDVSGKFAYVTNTNDHTISIFAIDGTTGTLTARGAPFALPANHFPTSIAIVEKK